MTFFANETAITNISPSHRATKFSCSSSKDCFAFFSNILTWFGINSKNPEATKFLSISKFCKFSFPFYMHAVVIDNIIMYVIEVKFHPEDAKVDSASIIGIAISLLIWYSLYNKRISLQNLLACLGMTSDLQRPKLIHMKLFLALNIGLMLIYTGVSMYLENSTEQGKEFCAFYYYHIINYCHSNFPHYLYIFIKTVSSCFVSTLFCNIISLLFCSVCYHCCAMLSAFRTQIDKIISSKSFHLLQPCLYKKYNNICFTIYLIQNTFSLTIFLAFVANFIQAFIILANSLSGVEMTDLDKLDYICNTAPSILFCLLVPGCAAQISIEMKRNQAKFCQLYDIIVFNRDARQNNVKITESLKQILPITLSAGEMIEFSSNIVPAVIGTLLTYGLLILNMDKQ